MARWHVNPETGKPGKCEASFRCPFGGDFNGHSDTRKEAMKVYEEFAAGVFDSNKSSFNYAVSDEEKEAFSSGDCGRLAQTFRDDHEMPMTAVGISNGLGAIEWVHMTSETSDGRLLDVNGLYTPADLIEGWASHSSLESDESIVLRKIALDTPWEPMLDKNLGDVDYPHVDPGKAAKAILETYRQAGLVFSVDQSLS